MTHPRNSHLKTARSLRMYALLGLVLGSALGLVLNAPARWLTHVIEQASQEKIVFAQVRGTAWNGSARVLLRGGADATSAAAATTLPGDVSWAIRPGLRGLHLQVQATCCMQQAWRIDLLPAWGGGSLVLADSTSQWPAQWLAGLGTPWNTVQAEGRLDLTTEQLRVDWHAGRISIAGRAQLDAQQMTSRLSTLKPLGSYRLTLQGGSTPQLTLTTLEGSLLLAGQGQWVGAQLRFEGVASALPERLDALANLLNILGRREGTRSLIKIG